MKIPHTLSCLSPPLVFSLTTLTLLVQSVWASDSAMRPFPQVPSVGSKSGGEQVVAAAQFNSHFLNIGPDQPVTDLNMFSHGQQVVPGVYLADVHVNGTLLEQLELRFDIPSAPASAAAEVQRDPAQKSTALPCLTRSMLSRWGVDLSSVRDLAVEADDVCFNLPGIIEGSQIYFDVGRQQLHLSVPQVFMRRVARGYVSSDQWDPGITAGIVNYQLSASRNEAKGGNAKTTNSFNGAVQAGLNIGEWRLRHRSNYNRNDGKGSWRALETYVQRDIQTWRSRLTIGDGFTSGEILDGISLRGVQLSSDESMLPDSLRGYAPVIRGIAQTSAKVIVKQNGYEIFTTHVAPGPFIIDDLFPTSASGELEVTIEEADGRKTVFLQPYSALPTQVREGAWRYTASAGKYRNVSGKKEPVVAQGTVAYGLNSRFSLYGGVQAAGLYQSVLMGVGAGLGSLGAASVDITHARSKDPASVTQQGQSLRFLYAKSFLPTGTDFRVLGYRYSTKNFRSLSETINLYDANNWQSQAKRRHRLEGNISQRLGGGSINGTLALEKYWNGYSNRSAQISYNNSFKKISYNVSYTYAHNRDLMGVSTGATRSVAVNLSVPLDWSVGEANPRTTFVSYNASSDLEGGVSQNANVSGLLLANSALNYNVSMGHSNTNGASGGAGITYRSPYANIGANYNQSRNYKTATGSLSGGMVIHRGGVTLAQSLGDTIVLVNAPGAKGVALENHPGVKTDSSGYAVLPYATAYRQNRVALNTEDLGDDVEVKHAAVNVVPTRGAVVLAQYETRQGYKVLLTLRDAHNKPVPFGALVEDPRGREAGIVGADGQVYLTGVDADGELVVKWGSSVGTQSCRAKYAITPRALLPVSETKPGHTELLMSKASCLQ